MNRRHFLLRGAAFAVVAPAALRALAAPAVSAELVVGRFASPNPGSVNTFWLHAPDGVIIVDTGRNLSGGRRVAAELQAAGQAVLAIMITHPHPDHVGGAGILHEAFPDAPIYASEATATWMRTDPLGFYNLARQADPDYPAELTFPDHMFGPDEVLEIGGITFETAQFGPGESETATAYYEPASGALFSGDLTNNHATPALLEGHTCGWLANLDLLLARFPEARTVYAGHGDPAELGEQIDAQRAYLLRVRELVGAAIDPASPEGETVTPEEQRSIISDLDAAYPDYPLVASLATLKEENVKAVARELTEGGCGEPPTA